MSGIEGPDHDIDHQAYARDLVADGREYERELKAKDERIAELEAEVLSLRRSRQHMVYD